MASFPARNDHKAGKIPIRRSRPLDQKLRSGDGRSRPEEHHSRPPSSDRPRCRRTAAPLEVFLPTTPKASHFDKSVAEKIAFDAFLQFLLRWENKEKTNPNTGARGQIEKSGIYRRRERFSETGFSEQVKLI